MPWAHCDHPEILDTDPCPSCEITKKAWTVEIEVTRTFMVSARGLRLVLLNPRELGVAEEPYRVELSDGEVLEGELNEEGRVRLSHGRSGECRIVFPERLTGEVLPYEPEGAGDESAEAEESDESPEAEDESESEEPTETPPAAFEGCDLNQRHRFQVQHVGVLIWTLYDEEDEEPLRFTPYSVDAQRAGEQVSFEGKTDRRGRLDHGLVDLTLCTLRVGDGEQIVPAVVPRDAGMRVRVRGVPARELEAVYDDLEASSWPTD